MLELKKKKTENGRENGRLNTLWFNVSYGCKKNACLHFIKYFVLYVRCVCNTRNHDNIVNKGLLVKRIIEAKRQQGREAEQ